MNKIVQLPSGARATMQLIETLRSTEKPVTIPGINYRGATQSDIERTAFEVERQFCQCIAAVRALVININENLPIGDQVNAESLLTDTAKGAADLVSELRGRWDRLLEHREWDR